MALAGALGVLLTLSVVRTADHTTAVLVATRDLEPGAVIDATSVRVARVRADARVLGTLFAGVSPAVLRGQVVTSAVGSGALITRAVVRDPSAHAASRVMSFPLPRARAVDGRLDAGDRVDVIAVDHTTGRGEYVVNDAEIAAVDTHRSGPLGGGSDDITVTLVVDPQRAPRLAAAVATRVVTLVRTTGAPPLTEALG
jgi:Flp pilus assembly protein CpaB